MSGVIRVIVCGLAGQILLRCHSGSAVTVSESDPDVTGESTLTGSATLTFAGCSITLRVTTTCYGALVGGLQLTP